MPPGLGNYCEINYLEVVFQQMQRNRRTSLGCPLPDYVRYEPGICPKAEEAAGRFRALDIHHATDAEAVRAEAVELREEVEQATP